MIRKETKVLLLLLPLPARLVGRDEEKSARFVYGHSDKRGGGERQIGRDGWMSGGWKQCAGPLRCKKQFQIRQQVCSGVSAGKTS